MSGHDLDGGHGEKGADVAGGKHLDAGQAGPPARGRAIGRRTLLAMGGAGAATMLASAGAASAFTGSEVAPQPRGAAPGALDPANHRVTGSSAPPGPVYRLALAVTDGWVSMPAGSPAIAPYHPDTIADAGRTTYTFGFRNVTNLERSDVESLRGLTQICAPLFGVESGGELWVVLTNLGLAVRPDLTDSHTLHWHGFRNAIPFYDGVPETSVSVPIGRDFTYVFRPKASGTYMYHCHFEDVEHVTMGMTGIVYVTPKPADMALTTTQRTNRMKAAYGRSDGDIAGESAYQREFAILLTEIDSRAHWNDAHIQVTDWTDFHADFWLMNGRAYPDTLAPNFNRDAYGTLTSAEPANRYSRPELAQQPLSSLIQARPGERVLVRIANLGFQNQVLTAPGIPFDVVGRDSRFVPAAARRKATDSIQIGPGESRDVIFTAPGNGTYPLYNRDLSRFTGGTTASSDQWIGGMRTHIVVDATFAEQLKPNGWAGEAEWNGERPVRV